MFASPAPEHGNADELRRVLGRTLGVPLFQEQAMRIAIEAARFTPEEANQLRRAMATFRHVGTIQTFEAKMVEGMVARGYDRTFATRCFDQIKGFGTYGFPESHAASFAHLVYVSAWLKCYHPAVFACALLNSQPMGFYAPAQIVRDAREHAVPVRGDRRMPQCVGLHAGAGCDRAARIPVDQQFPHRMGRRHCPGPWAHQGFKRSAAIAAAHPGVAMPLLMRTHSAAWDWTGRAALWQVRGLDDRHTLPLFAHHVAPSAQADLPFMTRAEQVIADYQTVQLSLAAHPMSFLRPQFARDGVITCAQAMAAPDRLALHVAGVVLVRQRPGSAKGVIFATIEDETGIANIVIWNSLQEQFRRAILGASLLEVHGRAQRSAENVVHIVAESLYDRTPQLRLLSDDRADPPMARADEIRRPQHQPHAKRSPGHPRDERPIPRSRDFH